VIVILPIVRMRFSERASKRERKTEREREGGGGGLSACRMMIIAVISDRSERSVAASVRAPSELK